MVKIAPSILSADFTRLGVEIWAAEDAGADCLHIDVMDGRFVPNITIGPFVVEAIKKAAKIPLDVHLMIVEPEKFVEDFINAGADFLTIHAEASAHLNRSLNWIKQKGVKAGVSINPATPVSALNEAIFDADLVLLMSVNPGFGGQRFIPRSMDKLRELKASVMKRSPNVIIEVDGGVTPGNARELADAGADMLVMGSAFFGSEDYKVLMSGLRKKLGG